MIIEAILIVVSSMICFFLGLAMGSAGKSSEKERADSAVEMANDYKKENEELKKRLKEVEKGE